VLTGHTRDDDAETILLNLIRGTGGAGLAGIPRHRPPNVYRPLLGVTRAETREIAMLAGLPFRDDPMNDDLGFSRNRLRHRVMPLLTELNPRAVEAITRAGAIVDSDLEYLEGVVDDLDVSRALPVALVTTLPRPLADRLLMRMLGGAGLGATSGRISRMWEVAEGKASRHELAEGLTVRREGAVLVIE
jgi:tRNA(Ile)-lysidine synthase